MNIFKKIGKFYQSYILSKLKFLGNLLAIRIKNYNTIFIHSMNKI